MAEEEPTPPDVGDALKDVARPTLETFIDFATQIWWFWLLAGLVLLGRLVLFVVRQRRLERSGILDIDRMSGRTFEEYLRTAYVRLGYKVELTKYRGDFGADLVVRKDGEKTAVQAKRYSKNVGVKAVQEAVAAKGYYDADAAMVVTNRYYTAQAKELARKNKVTLWDRDKLQSVLLQTDAREQAAAPSEAREETASPSDTREQTADAAILQLAPTTDTGTEAVCAACGAAVSEKVRAYCVANADRFEGAIYCFPHQRRFRRAR